MTITSEQDATPTSDTARNQRVIDHRFAPHITWTAICRPDDPHKTLVREDGALLYDLVADRNTWCFTRVIEFALRTSLRPVEVTQQTEDARTPIVRTTIRYPHATLELTAFAHLDADGRRSDIVLWDIQVAEDAGERLRKHGVLYGRAGALSAAIGRWRALVAWAQEVNWASAPSSSRLLRPGSSRRFCRAGSAGSTSVYTRAAG